MATQFKVGDRVTWTDIKESRSGRVTMSVRHGKIIAITDDRVTVEKSRYSWEVLKLEQLRLKGQKTELQEACELAFPHWPVADQKKD